MKKVYGKIRQTLSVLLAAAMVITMVPQNALTVSAAELEAVEEISAETIDETAETVEAVPEEDEEIPEETGDDETETVEEDAPEEDGGGRSCYGRSAGDGISEIRSGGDD